MTSEAEGLLALALALPVGDRAGVAAVLLSSLDGEADADQSGVEEAWVAELQARGGRVAGGNSAGVPWEEVRDGLVGRLSPQ